MARKKRPWDLLYDRVRVFRDAEHTPVPPVTDADLDDTASAIGVSLPVSYREFMRRFGPGHLSGWWLSPLIGQQTRPPETVVQATLSYRAAAEKYPDDFPNGEWHAGVIRFGSYGPHDLAWNGLDAEEARTAERPVYDLCSDEEQGPLTLATSFWGFVERVEQISRDSPIPFWVPEPGLCFRPAKLADKR